MALKKAPSAKNTAAKVTSAFFDWKDTQGGLQQIQKALKAHGVIMKQAPETRGSDSYGFRFSRDAKAIREHEKQARD